MAALKYLPFCFVVFLWLSGMQPALSQPADDQPIYLDEPEPEPAPRVAARKTLTEKYKDESIRLERNVVKLSNDVILNDGKYTEYYPDGQKYTEGNFKMGVFEGEWQYWFPNGQLRKKVPFKNGLADGQWDVFNEEGVRISQKSYQSGRRHGGWTNFHPDGKTPKLTLTYEKGVPSGERVSYYENGQKRQAVGFSKEGKFDGVMTEWDEAGKKLYEAEFVNGSLKGKVKRFDE